MMTVWAVGVTESLTVPNVPEKVYAEIQSDASRNRCSINAKSVRAAGAVTP